MEIRQLNLTFSTDELRKLISEYPDYPIVVLVGETASTGDYSWTYCSNISVGVEEILDARTPYGAEDVEANRENFEEMMETWLREELGQNTFGAEKMPEAEFQEKLRLAIAEFEPYWKKAIVICADN